MDNKAFGKQLHAARLQKNLTAKELGDRIGTTAMGINQIESGRRSTSLKTFVNICNELEKDPKYFLFKELNSQLNNSESKYEKLFKCILELPKGELERIYDQVQLYLKNHDKYI